MKYVFWLYTGGENLPFYSEGSSVKEAFLAIPQIRGHYEDVISVEGDQMEDWLGVLEDLRKQDQNT